MTASDGAGGDYFGWPMPISGDTVVVGAKGDDSSKGAAYVYQEEVAAGGGVFPPLILRNNR
jgi:hypothetical protein